VTSSQLNQVNTPTWYKPRNQGVNPLASCSTIAIECLVISAQLNKINTVTGNKEISQVPPSFEVSQTPLVDFPICGTQIEMS